jgi:hypothetical protein
MKSHAAALGTSVFRSRPVSLKLELLRLPTLTIGYIF